MQENKLQSSTGKENVIMWNPHRLICLSKELSSGVSGLWGGSFGGGGVGWTKETKCNGRDIMKKQRKMLANTIIFSSIWGKHGGAKQFKLARKGKEG